MCTPSVTAAAENEWPLPTARTGKPSPAAALITAAISAVPRGCSTRVAAARWLPAQFRQAAEDGGRADAG